MAINPKPERTLQVNLLLEGKKSVKGRRTLPLKKGDIVTGCGEGGEGATNERGVIDAEHQDGQR
ncbi:hypothetical protein T484DRAFT_1818908 [Baffinella frigidus]|nr:hypothetical protein T484DRAFT_1818908 [Cryptophyta sp. CCMP2293]